VAPTGQATHIFQAIRSAEIIEPLPYLLGPNCTVLPYQKVVLVAFFSEFL
jgi:hypothetical protein